MTLSVGKNQPPGNLHVVGLDWCSHLGKQLAFSCQAEFLNTWSPAIVHLSLYQRKTQSTPKRNSDPGIPGDMSTTDSIIQNNMKK